MKPDDDTRSVVEPSAICPACGSADIVPIVYGEPTRELWDEVQAGKVESGGCCITLDSPTRRCKACGTSWR